MAAYQFLSRAYTDILGRAPDPVGWNYWQSQIESDRSANQIRRVGSTFFNSGEFASINYTAEQRVATLYRVGLSREPDAGGVRWWASEIDSGRRSLSQVVNDFFWGNEFGAIAPIYQGKYDFRGGTPYRQSNTPIISSAQFQQILNSAKPGDRIELTQGSLIEVTSMIIVPNGIEITTAGNPGTFEYQKMARFVRSPSFTDGAMFAITAESKLKFTWVDGQRNTVDNPNFKAQNINIGFVGGLGAIVEGNRVDNSLGFSNITIAGEAVGLQATNAIVRGNFIDATTSNYSRNWTDGISNGGEYALIEFNTIINATDVGIVAFAMPTQRVQNSIIRFNTILNLSNSSYGGIVSDGVLNSSGFGSAPGSYAAYAEGLEFSNNVLWTSNGAFMSIALSVGTRAWFGRATQTINGSTFRNNTSNGQVLRVGTGIVVSGAINVAIAGNQGLNFAFAPEAKRALPRLPFVASVSTRYASFKSADMGWVDMLMDGAIVS